MASQHHPPGTSASTSDEGLVHRAQQGDLDAFTELVNRFEGRVFNFIGRRLGGRSAAAQAEDLTQETLLRAWRSIGDFQPRHRFSTWLFTIASRLVVDHVRHESVKRAALEDVGAHAAERLNQSDRTHTINRVHAHAEGQRLWSIAARLLSREQHAALWLRYAEDLSPGEVARVLNRREVAVRVMLFRARQAIAAHVSGGMPETHPARALMLTGEPR